MEFFLSVLDVITKRIFYSTKLYWYEELCLESMKRKLSSEAVYLLERQLEQVSFVMRQNKKKVVSFGYIEGISSFSELPDDLRFPLKTNNEIHVATILLQHTNQQKIRGNIIFFKGQLSSIEFNLPPKKFTDKKDVIEVNKVTLHLDLMQPDLYKTEKIRNLEQLNGWTKDLAEKFGVKDLNKALASTERKKIIDKFDGFLPDYYLEIVSNVEGMLIKHINIFGLSEIFTIVHPDYTYYAIAEINEKGFLGIRDNEKKEQLYFIPHEETDNVTRISKSFRDFIEKELEEV